MLPAIHPEVECFSEFGVPKQFLGQESPKSEARLALQIFKKTAEWDKAPFLALDSPYGQSTNPS